jgi:predicted ATPase
MNRAAVAESLRTALHRADDGQGAVCLLTGASGLGKTHVATEFLRDAQHAQKLTGHALASGGPPLLPICDALTSGDQSQSAAEAKSVAKQYAKSIPLLREVLGPLLSAQEQLEYTKTLPRELVPSETFVFYALTEILRRIARHRTTILFLDDTQWLDGSSTGFLGHLVPDLNALPILLLLVGKTNGDVPRPLAQLRETLTGVEHAAHLALDALDDGETAAFVARLLEGKVEITDEQLTWLTQTSRGNPRLLREVLVSLRDKGVIVQQQGAWGFTTAPTSLVVPASFAQLVQDHVTAATNGDTSMEELVGLAAVLGSRCDVRVLARATAQPVHRTIALLTRFGSATGYLRRVGSTTHVEFDHDLTREAILLGLGSVQEDLHATIASTLMADRHAPAAQIAYHLEHAGQSRDAGEMYLRAGDRAAMQSAYTEAAMLYLRADRILAQDGDHEATPLRIDAASGHAEALIKAEQYEDATRYLRQRVRDAGEPGRLLTLLGRAAARLPQHTAHQEAVRALTKATRLASTPEERAAIWTELIYAEDSVGNYDGSAAAFRQAMVTARQLHNPALIARLLRLTCIFWQPEKVVESIDEGLRIARREGLLLEEILLLNNRSTALTHLRRFEEAEHCLLQARDWLIGHGGFRADAPTNNLGIIAFAQDHLVQALSWFEQASASSHDDHSLLFIKSNIAVTHHALGASARARADLEALLPHAEATGDLFYRACVRHNLALVQLALGDATAAAVTLDVPVHRHAPDEDLIQAKRAVLQLRVHEALGTPPPPGLAASAALLDRTTKPQAWLYRMPWYLVDIEFWED